METNQRGGSTRVELDLDGITPAELLRVQRLARELRLTDQILSNDLDTVSVVQTGPAPAWTTLEGDKVSFAMNQMPKPMTRLDVAVWLGTNAHELGHVLYSPRRDSTLMYRVLESDKSYLPGMAMLHNIVEDQRQERLVLARFAPWRGYLTAALGHHLRGDSDTSWLLMAGRTWLPQDVRDGAKAAMIVKHGSHVTDTVTRVIGDYQRLTDPGDMDGEEAWNLLNELHTLFADDMPRIPTGCTVMSGGEPDTGEPGSGAPATADEADAGGQGGDADDDTDAPAGDSGDTDTGEGDGDEGNDDDSDQGGGSGASNTPAPKPLTKDGVKRALKSAAQRQIESDEETVDDVDNILDAIEHGRGGDDPDGPTSEGQYAEATDVALRLRTELSDALLDLKDETEPGWLKRVDSGRLNVRRLLSPNVDADELFDRYEPGMMDASELEVVVLLDVSSSMAPSTRPLAEATWAIRMAVDDLEGRCTVITWESGPHSILADANTRPDGRMFVPRASGGTNPESALIEAFRLIAGSASRNRLVVILTDDDWSNSQKCEQVIAAMNEYGVVTVCALLGAYTKDMNAHGCTYGAVIDQPDELARLFRRVAVERIRSWQ